MASCSSNQNPRSPPNTNMTMVSWSIMYCICLLWNKTIWLISKLVSKLAIADWSKEFGFFPHYFGEVFAHFWIGIFGPKVGLEKALMIRYSPVLKKGGYIGFGFSVILFLWQIPSFIYLSIIILFPLNILRKNWDFHQISYMHSYWQELAWDCYTSFFTYLYQSYGPRFTPKFRFRSISWE